MSRLLLPPGARGAPLVATAEVKLNYGDIITDGRDVYVFVAMIQMGDDDKQTPRVIRLEKWPEGRGMQHTGVRLEGFRPVQVKEPDSKSSPAVAGG